MNLLIFSASGRLRGAMNLLITGAWRQARAHITEIEALRHSVAFLQDERGELPCRASWIEGIVGNGIFLAHPIQEFVNLRYIQLTSAGFDRVPMAQVRSRNIEIHNAAGVYSVPMAEYAMLGVLQLCKGADFYRRNQRRHQWVKNREARELCGRKVLIVGCGSVGTECAKRFRAFGCTVIGLDLAARVDEHFDEIRPVGELDSMLPEADVLILTVPLTEQTRGLMNAERLGRLKRSAILVNICRGGVIDERALAARVDSLGGAVLDVFEAEPLPPDSPLWDKPNVIISPHNSFVGDGNDFRLSRLILQNLKQAE